MLAIYIIGGIFSYFFVGGINAGLVRRGMVVKDKLTDSQENSLAANAFLWPVMLGYNFATRQPRNMLPEAKVVK